MKLAQTLLAQSSGKDPQAPGPAQPAGLDISGTPEPGTDSLSSPMDRFLAGVEHKAFKIAVYALRDKQTALDVVQDAMFKLVEKYSKKPESEWPPLFFTILNNRITDIRRWRKLREVGGKTVSLFRNHGHGEEDLLDAGLGTELNSPRMQPEKVLLSKQIRKQIDSALENLSDRQRQVFMLREWQGMSVRDTATVLGCSEGSVKQHHFRAMRCLREQLNEIRDHGHT